MNGVAVTRVPWRSCRRPSVVVVVVVVAVGVVGGLVAQRVVWVWEEVPKIAMVRSPATRGEDGAKQDTKADDAISEIATNVSDFNSIIVE
jgi:hypothetical protein